MNFGTHVITHLAAALKGAASAHAELIECRNLLYQAIVENHQIRRHVVYQEVRLKKLESLVVHAPPDGPHIGDRIDLLSPPPDTIPSPSQLRAHLDVDVDPRAPTLPTQSEINLTRNYDELKGKATGKGVHSSLNDGMDRAAETTWNRALEIVGDRRQTLSEILQRSAAFTLNQLPGLAMGTDAFRGRVWDSLAVFNSGSCSSDGKGQGKGEGPNAATAASEMAAVTSMAQPFATAPPSVQKQMIGEELYPKVAKYQPDLAGKITGMLLELDNSVLLRLLACEKHMSPPLQLEAMINEAMRVLAQAGKVATGSSSNGKGMGQGKDKGSNGKGEGNDQGRKDEGGKGEGGKDEGGKTKAMIKDMGGQSEDTAIRA